MIDQRLSRDIEIGAKARPRYSTDIVTTDGGYEFRTSRWAYPLFSFEFTVEPGNSADDSADPASQTLKEFVNLWHACGGRYNTFKFRHWSDYIATGNVIGTGDGMTLAFQLYRTYTAGAVTRTRKITRPVQGSVTAYVNGIESPVSVNEGTGVITFGLAPTNGSTITADFQFDIPVRFGDDELEMVALMTDLDQPVNITLMEVRE